MELYGSIQSISGSMTASVFTGSFKGDGSGLYGISATGVTGLNLSQISTGSVIASVSQDGFNVNSDTSITGTLKVNGTIIAEQIDVTIYSSSVLYQSGSTRFGDTMDDTHNITGSVNITGSISLNGQAIGTGKLDETVFNTYTSSVNPKVSSLENASGSIRNDFNSFTSSYNTTSGSFNTRIGNLESFSSSLDVAFVSETEFGSHTSSNNTFTSSVDGRLNSLENASGSIRTDFNSYTSSNNSTNTTQNSRLNSLESTTGSLNSFTSSIDTTIKNKLNNDGIISTSFQVDLTQATNYTSFSSSIATTDLNQNNRLNSIETSTGSLNSYTSSTNGRLSSIESTTSSLNSFVSTAGGRLDSLESASGSIRTDFNSYTSSNDSTNSGQNNRLTSIESTTGSLNSYTSSNNTRLGIIETTTSSLNSYTSSNNNRVSSIESTTSSLNSYTSSNNTRLGVIESTTSSLNTYTSSNNTRLGTIETTTSSLNSFTSSTNGRLNNVETSTGSLNTFTSSTNTRLGVIESTTGSLNSYTSSNNTRLGVIEGTTSSLNTFTSSTNTRLNAIETSTGSINSFTSSINTTIKNKLNSDGVISGSAQVSLTQTTGYSTFSSSLATTDLGQDNRLSSIEGKTGSYATTGSNIFIGNQTITGSLFVSQDLIIAGSSSIQHISSSVVNIADNIITVNAQNPSIRFGGLAVIDSGSSPQVSGSMLFDSTNDQWIFIHQNQSTVTSSVLLMGPQTFNNLGSETYPTTNKVLKSVNAEHVGDSNITDTGTKVSVNSNTEITGSLIVTGDKITVNAVGGDEGGEILLGKAVTNTTLSGQGVTIDVWQNRLRFFEQGGNARGAYLDVSTLSNGVGTNLNVTSNVSALESTTASLNSYTSSNTTNINAIHTATSSLNSYTSSTNTRLGVIESTTASLNSYTSSNTTNINAIHTATSSLNSYTSSNTTNINSIHTATSSLNSFTSSASGRLSSIETSTGSLNTFTSSAGTRLGNLETSTGSLNSFTNSINTTIKNKLNSDGVVSGSSQISFGSISNVPSGLVSGSSQVSYPSLSNIPSGIVSGSSQITLSSTTGFGTYLDQAVKSGSTVTFNYVTSNRFIQTAHATTLSNSSYNTEAVVYANAGAGANIYPGYGFHKSGELGVFLYATNRSTLRLRADDGNDYKLWHDGNDGASSGLDSDLLDGQHGSYYATDSAVVKLTGTQTIAGEKTFSDRIIYSKPLYRSFDTFAGADDSRRTKTYSGVLVAASDISGAEAYTIIDTNVPQDNFQMGGFTIEIMMNYENTNNKTKVDLAGYWNPESNGGFTGWEAHFSNAGYTPTIQIARKTATGNVSFIITNSSPSYQIIVARDLWLGYNESTAESTEKTWGDDWAIIQSANTTAYTNLDTVVNRSSSVSAGTGISVNTTTNAVTVTNTGTLTVAGTANQVLINGSTSAANGNITLSLPQSIGTGSSPTFNGLTSTGALSVGYSGSTEPFIQGHFYNANTTVSTQYGGILVSGINQAHVRFQVGTNSWGASGAKQWQIRVGNGTGEDNFKIYSWTKGSDTMTILNNGNTTIHGTIAASNLSGTNTGDQTLSSLGALSNNADSEQDVGTRNLYYNDGAKRVFSDPRWNESGYDGDLGTLHIYSTTAAGANYGRAGIALYNGSAYQYLTTKASTTGLFANNSLILTAGNYTSYAMAGAGYSANQNLSTTSTVTFGNLRVGSGGSTNAGLVNITGANDNQVNITHDSSWGLLLGYCNEGSSSGYHGSNHAAIINVRSAPIHFGTNNSSNVQISSSGHLHPSANNTYDCGTSSLAWRNVYTNDLHLSNMNKPEGNDVDGTNGNWTIQEGAENLYIINNNNGKKFKISLEEIK